jgi:hypothetical protein
MNINNYPKLSSQNKIWLIILALFGAGIILFSTHSYGAGISSDSVDYISAARNIINGTGAFYFDGTPLVLYPPLYPALVAIVGKIVGMDPLSYTNFIDAFLFGLIIYLGGILIFKYLKYSPPFFFVGILAIVFSKPLFSVSVMAWSEPLFICLVLLSLIFANSYILRNNITSLLLFSLSVAILPLVRYAGVIIIIWGVLVIFMFSSNNSFKNRLKHLIIFAIISIIPIGFWLIRNYIISRTLFGARLTSTVASYPFLRNVFRAFYLIIKWYGPIILYCGVGITLVTIHRLRDSWDFVKIKMPQIGPIILLIVIYISFLFISTNLLHVGRTDDRLLAPIYIPITLLLLIVTEKLFESYKKLYSIKIAHFGLVLGIIIWLIYPPITIVSKVVDQKQNGYGYSGKVWKASKTVQYLCQPHTLESGSTYFTNSPETIYILANFTAKMSPYKTKDISTLKGFWPQEKKSYLIWFDQIESSDLSSIDELKKVANIDLIARFDDGAFYSITRN